jgi:hypothetical protein
MEDSITFFVVWNAGWELVNKELRVVSSESLKV